MVTWKCSLAVIILLSCMGLPAIAQKPDCSVFHHGSFYSYPKNSNNSYKIINKGDVQLSINVQMKDTSYWKLKWKKPCEYQLEYMSGGIKEMSAEQIAFARKTKLIYTIESVTAHYYHFKMYLNSSKNTSIGSDTLWFNERLQAAGIFWSYVPADSLEYYEKRFNADSDYALVYVYRRGKFLLSLMKYLVLVDDNVAGVLINRSAVVFKVKPGLRRFKADVDGVTGEIAVDIVAGMRYFLESITKWGSNGQIGNNRLLWQQQTEEEGMKAFNKVISRNE